MSGQSTYGIKEKASMGRIEGAEYEYAKFEGFGDGVMGYSRYLV